MLTISQRGFCSFQCSIIASKLLSVSLSGPSIHTLKAWSKVSRLLNLVLASFITVERHYLAIQATITIYCHHHGFA